MKYICLYRNAISHKQKCFCQYGIQEQYINICVKSILVSGTYVASIQFAVVCFLHDRISVQTLASPMADTIRVWLSDNKCKHGTSSVNSVCYKGTIHRANSKVGCKMKVCMSE